MEPRFPLSSVDQVCVVVDDLEKTIARYWSLFGIGPWQIWRYPAGTFKEATYKGRSARFGMQVALAKIGPLAYEVIEPLEGPSIYTDFLAAHGPGLQHLGVIVPDIDAAIAALRAEGYEVLMSGRGHGVRGDGAFAYMGTHRDLAAVVEFLQPPVERRPPDRIYP